MFLAQRALTSIVLCLAASGAASAQQPQLDQLRLIAPAAPGGGWDQTARVMQQVLQRSGIVRTAPVENIPGAAGTIGLARFVGSEQGRDDAILVSGLIMLGGIVMHRSPVTLHEVTPIARLTGEYEAIVVPANSPIDPAPRSTQLGYFQVIAEPVSTCVHEIWELRPRHSPRLVTKL